MPSYFFEGMNGTYQLMVYMLYRVCQYIVYAFGGL